MARRRLLANTRTTSPRVTLSRAEMHGLSFNGMAVNEYMIAEGDEVIVYYDDDEHAFILERVARGTFGALAFLKPDRKYDALRLTMRGAVTQVGLDIPETVAVEVDLDGDEIVVRLPDEVTVED